MPGIVLKIRRFMRDSLSFGGLRLHVLRLREVEERQVSGDPLDAALGILEEESKAPGPGYVVVEVQSGRGKSIMGEVLGESRGSLLFPKPSRLRRVGIVRVDALSSRVESGIVRLKESDIEWFNVEGEDVYVFDSPLEAPENIAYVIVDAEDGRRYVRVQRFSTQKLYGQPQPPQAELTGSNEAASSEGSSPS
ncbi:MAG: hypothetical protein P3X22_002440 [Thermoprotei archaeon]|nr:hypothetical protein [Thermoprotei archaeon]